MADCLAYVIDPLTGLPILDPVEGGFVVVQVPSSPFVTELDIEPIRKGLVKVSWCGDVDKLAWIFVNGELFEGPLWFDEEDKEFLVKVPDLYYIEVHEHGDTVFLKDAIEDPLKRHPEVQWSRVAGTNIKFYRLYRKPYPAASSYELLSRIQHVADTEQFVHQVKRDQRQDGGKWNFYRVNPVGIQDDETTGKEDSIFVPGLPARPLGITTVDVGGAPKITLTF